jgi:hypothetical protein
MTEYPIATAAPAAADSAILADLRDLCADALRDLTMKVGAYVFRTFFDSSEEAFGSHVPTKADRFTEFTARTEESLRALGLSERTLLHYTRVFIVFRQMPPPVQQQLDPSHYVELYRLPAPVDRTKLALRAAQEHWSVRMLREEVDAWRAQNLPQGKSPGRPRLPDAVKAWGGAARLVAGIKLDKKAAAKLTDKERQLVLALLGEVEERMRGVRAVLGG